MTFETGDTEARVSAQITDDNMVENVEEFTATLSSLENVMIVEDRATVTVLDNNG